MLSLNFVMRTFVSCLILVLFLTACKQKSGENSVSSRLKEQKYKTDSLISDKSLLVFAKIRGKEDLLPIENRRYPQNIEATFNVLKNKDGRVVYIAEMPFNAENDYFIAYKNYFDEEGKLYVFQRLNNFFGSECTKGAAIESLTKFYSADFKAVDSTYTLTDSNKKELNKATCKFPYNFPYQIFKTVDEYRKEKGIQAF